MTRARVCLFIVLLVTLTGASEAGAFTPTRVELDYAPPRAAVYVDTDGNWRHWRHFRVRATDHLARNERCRARLDASRVLRGKPVTQGLPRRCMSRRDRRVHPDAKGER